MLAPMSHRIICAIDNDARASGVVRLAASFSAALGVDLLVVHCVEPTNALPLGRGALGSRTRRFLMARGRELVTRCCQQAGCSDWARARVEVADPKRMLVSLAGDPASELVVVGSRGRGRFKSALLGSVSRRLAAEAACPVAVLPREANGDWTPPPKLAGGTAPTILCGVDGSAEAYAAVQWVAPLARVTGGSLLLAHVRESFVSSPRPAPVASRVDYAALLDTERRARLRILHRALDLIGDDLDTRVTLVAGRAPDVLEQLGKRECADLIAVGSRGHRPLKSALLGSTSADLASSAKRPVLICPNVGRVPSWGRHPRKRFESPPQSRIAQ